MGTSQRTLSKHFEDIRSENMEIYKNWVNFMVTNNYSPKSIDQYSYVAQIFFSWNYEFNGDKLFTDFLNKDFTTYIYYVRKVLKSAPRRINFHRSALTNMSRFIEKDYEEVYPFFKNKAKNIDTQPNIARRKKIIVTPDELEEMLEGLVAEKKYQCACWLAILAYSGCRRSEAIQLKVEWLTEAYEQFPAPYTMWKTPAIRTKGRGEEGKVIPKYIFKLGVKPYLDLWLEERNALGITDEYLFVKFYRGEYTPATETTATAFARCIRRMFNNGFHNHCMRHYFATDLRNRHFPNDIILKIVKWEDVKMIDHYDDTTDDEALDKYFSSHIEEENKPTKETLLEKFSHMSVDELLALLRR